MKQKEQKSILSSSETIDRVVVFSPLIAWRVANH
jgi:hypothetical protein